MGAPEDQGEARGASRPTVRPGKPAASK
jgi:hypothetical protein